MLNWFKRKINFLFLSVGSIFLLKLVSVNPRFAYVRVTENCNSKCKTCFAWKNKSTDELSTEEFKKVFRELRKVGVELIWLSGGEPLIRNDIGELVKECKLLGFKEIFIQTNGLLLSDKANELILNGITHIDVSIDGLKETNTLLRGVHNSFEKAVQGIKTVNKLKYAKGLSLPGVTVFTTLLKQNIKEVPKIIGLCQKMGVFWDFSLLDNNVDFFNEINTSEFTITDCREIDKIINYLKTLLIDKTSVISPSHTELSLEYARHYLKGNPQKIPCVLGFTHICIGSHGEVYPGCLSQEPVGNLREHSLQSIIKSRRYRKSIERMYKRQCPGCTFFYGISLQMKYLIKMKFKEFLRIKGRESSW